MSAGWDALALHPEDDVAVALHDLPAGTVIKIRRGDGFVTLCPSDPIELGHKVALRDIPAGDTMRKYGEAIGAARAQIPAGSHVHVHNIVSLRARASR
jgi:altronate dehydratase